MYMYIDLSEYDVLRVEAKLLSEELQFDGVVKMRDRVRGNTERERDIEFKEYKEVWEVKGEEFECKASYVNDKFESRVCQKVLNLMMDGINLGNYGKEMSKSFVGLLSTQDIVKQYNVNESTVRRAVLDGRLEEGKDCMKYGKSWVVKEESAERLWGNN